MKQKKWSPIQIQEALSLSKKVNYSVSGISINSKKLKKNNLFLPLKGKNYDGHKFINEAFKKGAKLSLSSKKEYRKYNLDKHKKKIILVNDPLTSLHHFAKYSRSTVKGKLLAITGSLGKTSVKEAIHFILKGKNKVQSSTGNFNNLIGMPINLVNFKKKMDINILELGMNKKGEIKKLSNICKPNIGLITKISNAHIGNFNSLKDIVKAKAEIFSGIQKDGVAIINANDPYHSFLKNVALKSGIKNIINFGYSKNCEVRLINFKYKNLTSCKVFLEVLGKKTSFNLKNLGHHWIENSLAIASVLSALDKDVNYYLKKLFNFVAVKGRGKILNIKYKNKKIVFIDDTYNSSPESLKLSINFLNHLGNKRRKICVLGDMYELGKFSKKYHLQMQHILKQNKITNVYTIGKEMKNLFSALPSSVECNHSENLDELFLNLKDNIKKNDIILFKASRAIQLDKVIKKFL